MLQRQHVPQNKPQVDHNGTINKIGCLISPPQPRHHTTPTAKKLICKTTKGNWHSEITLEAFECPYRCEFFSEFPLI